MIRAPAILLLVAVALPGAETRAERGRRILNETLRALGGERFLAMRDRTESGRAYSFYREQLAGLSRATLYTRYLTRPEPPVPGKILLRERQAFGKDQDYSVLFDEEDGWQISFRGARPVPVELKERYRETTLRNIFYILRQRLGEPGMIVEFQSAEVFENQPVEIVDISDSDNRTVTVFIHVSTRLPVRQVFQRRDLKTRDRHEEVTRFSRYRDIGGGVLWPFTILRERDGEKIFEMFAESITINQNLSDELFTLRANWKVLPPAR